MSLRTTFTTTSPLPLSIPASVVLTFLHDHQEMIDLNPLVKERHPIPPPPHAPLEEQSCVWYSLTDKISYLPGVSGDVTYTCAFTDLPDGIATHCYAPAGLTIRDRWTLVMSNHRGGGLAIREEVQMRCNMLLTAFVKRNIKKSHATLIERLKSKAQMENASMKLGEDQHTLSGMAVPVPGVSPPLPSPGLVPAAHLQGQTQSQPRRQSQLQAGGVGISAETLQFYERKLQAQGLLPAQPQYQEQAKEPRRVSLHDAPVWMTHQQYYDHISGEGGYGESDTAQGQAQGQRQVPTHGHQPVQFQFQLATAPSPLRSPPPAQPLPQPQQPATMPTHDRIPRQLSPNYAFAPYARQTHQSQTENQNQHQNYHQPQTHVTTSQPQDHVQTPFLENPPSGSFAVSSASRMQPQGMHGQKWSNSGFEGQARQPGYAVPPSAEYRPYREVGAEQSQRQGQGGNGGARPGMCSTLTGPFVAELA